MTGSGAGDSNFETRSSTDMRALLAEAGVLLLTVVETGSGFGAVGCVGAGFVITIGAGCSSIILGTSAISVAGT